MFDTFYTHFRSASGLTLIVVAIGFFVEPDKRGVRKFLGAMFSALGLLFILSVLSDHIDLPVFIDNFLILLIVYVLSQSFLEISLYLFGDEAVPGTRRALHIAGAAWSILVLALPILDLAFSLPVLYNSIEDGRPMALFLSISSAAVYVWHLGMTIVSLRAGRWSVRDLPKGSGPVRSILIGFAGLLVVLSVIGLSVILSSQALYRAAHTLLQILMLVWYFFIRSRPDTFDRARTEIGKEFKKRHRLSAAETKRVALKLAELTGRERIFIDPDLDLSSLAKAASVPAYRLSSYLNAHLGQTFSEWLNSVRVDYVRRLLDERPGSNILEIAMEAGYSSKTVFNTQFLRLTGMKPSEYRAKKSTPGGTDSVK